MSLSQEPALSVLANELICGYKDISNESYAGFSGKHKPGEQAINTTNGAGPHNLQTFLLSSDGTVMHCLPGYWNPQDLVREVEFAGRLHDIWTNKSLTDTQKRQYFVQMQHSHVKEHPQVMVNRSRMQFFDMEHEAKYNLMQSDTIADRGLARSVLNQDRNSRISGGRAFKTTDTLMHERMAKRPFVSYNRFDVAAFANYGRPMYDKDENLRNEKGQFVDNGRVVERTPDKARDKELIGKIPEQWQRRKDAMQRRRNGFGNMNSGSSQATDARLWGQVNSASKPVLWGAN